jgi:formylglycine-generating enzyme required for sulfatase activity
MRMGYSPAYRINGNTDPAAWGNVPTSNNATWNAVQIVEGSNGYRLPTEAQWEYACRAGTWSDNYSMFNWGNTINSTRANYNFNLDRTTRVGSYAPNAWGLYDMHGNVYEWCWDRYGVYPKVAQTDPTGPVSGSNRVTRGGSFGSDGEYVRSAFRDDYSGPFKRSPDTGFRVVRP